VVNALALAAACGANPATPQEGGEPVQARGAVETEIKRLEQMEVKAFLERDISILSKLWDAKHVVNNPDNKIVAGVSPEERPGLKKPRTSFTREVEHLTVRKNLVISMGGETIVPGVGEPHSGKTVHRRYTHIWQRVEGEWKLIARHANVFRVDPSRRTRRAPVLDIRKLGVPGRMLITLVKMTGGSMALGVIRCNDAEHPLPRVSGASQNQQVPCFQ